MKPLFKSYTMNKTELRYAGQLELLKRSNQIVDWRFNAIRFRLAEGAYYKPDFFIVKLDSFEIHETKGFFREAAKVRIKTAAELYPWFKWYAVQLKKKAWVYEEF